jgi:hypothetical protein
MIVNFRARRINLDTCKLARTLILILKKNKNYAAIKFPTLSLPAWPMKNTISLVFEDTAMLQLLKKFML